MGIGVGYNEGMIWGFFDDPISGLLMFGALLLAITVHEFAHAWVADYMGDPTARLQGRLTLNPLAHLDLIGTLFLIMVGFGWGKPVPVDDYNLSNPKKDMALIALAGPVSNLVTGGVAALILRFLPLNLPEAVTHGFLFFISLSLILAFFNLMPLYPLDGSKILMSLLPDDVAVEVDYFLKEYSFILLVLMLLPLVGGRSVISVFLSPLINMGMRLLVG